MQIAVAQEETDLLGQVDTGRILGLNPIGGHDQRRMAHIGFPVGQPLPLAENKLKIAHLSREITHALATGYKVLVMEQIAGIGRRDKKILITAMREHQKYFAV